MGGGGRTRTTFIESIRERRAPVGAFVSAGPPQAEVFGRRKLATVAAITPSRHLTSRVTADSDVNAFGLTPTLGGLLLLGIATLVVLHANDFRSVKRIIARFDPGVLTTFIAPTRENGGVFRIMSESPAGQAILSTPPRSYSQPILALNRLCDISHNA
ncbi:MAG: hypothetical protein JWQ07_5745 [Ramlibacter sp.]|nr:hypothetical protein [Ramlibacter sp.]